MGIANFKYINDAVASKPRIAFWNSVNHANQGQVGYQNYYLIFVCNSVWSFMFKRALFKNLEKVIVVSGDMVVQLQKQPFCDMKTVLVVY